jgi:hypothetical protein
MSAEPSIVWDSYRRRWIVRMIVVGRSLEDRRCLRARRCCRPSAGGSRLHEPAG